MLYIWTRDGQLTRWSQTTHRHMRCVAPLAQPELIIIKCGGPQMEVDKDYQAWAINSQLGSRFLMFMGVKISEGKI